MILPLSRSPFFIHTVSANTGEAHKEAASRHNKDLEYIGGLRVRFDKKAGHYPDTDDQSKDRPGIRR
ncbi:hypothetical protein D3C81_2118600 [compost metagenome]